MYYNSKSTTRGAVSLLVFFLIFILSITFASDMEEFVKVGLKLCFTSIIGTVFPFLILTDLLFCFSDFSNIKTFKSAFEWLFKINGAGLRAFIAGIVCGFPLGVKVANDLYTSGFISREECERLICFSNNTGPAFVIFAIGAGMRGNIKDGIILYLSMLLSAVVTGVLLGISKKCTKNTAVISANDYNFVLSIKNAATNTLYICSFIAFFSVVTGLLKSFLPTRLFIPILPFLEVANAASMLSRLKSAPTLSLTVTSFAISFSGISVMMQAKSFLNKEIKTKKYIPAKILQGCISMLFTYLLSLI